jgi:hypothetical protein
MPHIYLQKRLEKWGSFPGLKKERQNMGRIFSFGGE